MNTKKLADELMARSDRLKQKAYEHERSAAEWRAPLYVAAALAVKVVSEAITKVMEDEE